MMMNDTFDDFTFTTIEQVKVPSKNDISFDDSLFINSQELSILRSIENAKDESKSDRKVSSGFLEESLDKSNIFESDVSECSFLAQEKCNKSGNESMSKSLSDLLEDSTRNTESFVGKKGNHLNLQYDLATSEDFKLSSWNLPSSILEKYTAKNITTMFRWQVECLKNPKVLKHHANLVYSAPTSAGKTLVAEILAIKTVLERSKKVLFILPFVSVVREKMFYFREIFSGSGVRVEGFMGSYNPPGGFKNVQFAVCTIEKANSLVNHFLQEGTLSEIGAVVIDEMHLIGEPHRGYILELLLTKLKYISSKDNSVQIQIIGMSATLPNLSTLSQWLNAELYITDFRPIPLYEMTHIAGDIYDSNFKQIRAVAPLADLGTDTDNILQLCLETILTDCSVLIFCPTKNWCENLAQQISAAFFKLGSGQSDISSKLRQQLKSDLIGEVLEQLKCCPVGLDDVLRKTVSFGVGFHHAGLTLDERDIIEGAFRNGAVRVLTATSTLSSGVNLPAKRVIIRTPIFCGKLLDSLTYRQMIGRAGRLGKDTTGESILICQKSELKLAKSLMCDTLPAIQSCLDVERLKRAILEIVASAQAHSLSDVHLFMQCTLDPMDAKASIDFLLSNEFLRLQNDSYVATQLGKACLASSIAPNEALSLFKELEKARRCFVLDSELHLIYLVTPYSACQQWVNIDWMFYLDQWERLPSSMKRVAEMVGVRENCIIAASQGRPIANALVHKRFFVALALYDLVNEKSLAEVCTKFGCNRGMLQTLQLTASTFAGMVTSFSKQLGWSSVELLISQFQDRLHFGVNRDLLDLMRLPVLNSKSARALYNSGLENLVAVANSDVATIENVFHRVVPFETAKKRDGETDYALKQRQKMRTIWITGKDGLTEREAAELVLSSARDFLRIEMGLKEAHWNDNNTNKSDEIIDFDTSDIIETSDESFCQTPRKRHMSLICDSPLKKAKVAKTLEIVDVCQNPKLLQAFVKELSQKQSFSLCVCCQPSKEKKQVIGLTPTASTELYVYKNRKIEGITIAWDAVTVYYMSLNAKSLNSIRKILSQATIIMFDAKEQVKHLNKCNLQIKKIEDPKVADWLLDPDSNEKSFQSMVNFYCPMLAALAQMCGLTKSRGSPSLDISNQSDAKTCAAVECLVTWQLCQVVKRNLLDLQVFETEMSSVLVTAQMELNGIAVDEKILTNLVDTLQNKLTGIERKAYSLVGRRFNFSSTREVGKILNVQSTKKHILEKHSNPLSDLIMQWRKINCTLVKIMQPLLRSVENGRIYGSCVTFTATGRITMQEPNLQNVTKNFDIDGVVVSCRDAFTAAEGKMLVSADYCQLELRLLAHLSKDGLLCGIMRRKGDVFREIAAKWNKIKEHEVTDELRQRAKQICYGIIYGMGPKALSEQLNIDEKQASVFMDTFKSSYPGVDSYILDVIEKCKKDGFVETISGRRRFLPHIQNPNLVIRSQAERQAVNTTIQGSAADVVKQIMVVLDAKCSNLIGQPRLVLHLHDELLYEVDKSEIVAFANVLKKTMEGEVRLSVPFPVKVKVGLSWGQLTEMHL